MSLSSLAPAKINLYLHVAAPTPDGFHPLASLMAFADIGDEVRADDADDLSLQIIGPFAAGLQAEADNLVLRAARALAAAAGVGPRARLTLVKALPVAAGLGGGSSDAGAALRLQRGVVHVQAPQGAQQAVAESLGSDGAPCLWGRAVTAEGRGEILSSAPAMPVLPAVLVNPGVPSPTGAVYRAYDAMGAVGAADRPEAPALADIPAAAAWLAGLRNDLEEPALALEPRIGQALEALKASEETLLARMSGSGATCFALCPSDDAASALAERLGSEHPGWWVRPCRFGDASH